MANGNKNVRDRREDVLAHLGAEYNDALTYTAELRRAIDSFSGEIPADSPYRYLRQGVGDAILAYLTRVQKPQKISALIQELKAGHCLFGRIKSAEEITRKAVTACVRSKRLQWMDAKKSVVGLPGWKR
jgi:hypothetical protein